MAGLARRLAPAAALGGLAIVVVGIADPALAGHDAATAVDQTSPSTSQAAASDATTTPDVAATPEAATSDSAQTVTGPAVETRWGPVQVAATITNGQLTEVHAVVWPDGDRRSVEISQYAIPQLDAMATAQGVEFDGVSGATYTTEGYRESLQQLLDSL